MSEENLRLFIVDDDKSLCMVMRDYFLDEKFDISTFHDGETALRAIIEQQPDAVILDLELPHMDGIEVCRKARKYFKNPIIILTGTNDQNEWTEISSLDQGADKFIKKPVKLQLLNAHLNAMLRRNLGYQGHPEQQNNQLSSSMGVHLHAGSMHAVVDNNRIELSELELRILSLLIDNAGHCVSREKIHENARGFSDDNYGRFVDLKISKLRKKLNDLPPYKVIKTVRGKGYLFCDNTQLNSEQLNSK